MLCYPILRNHFPPHPSPCAVSAADTNSYANACERSRHLFILQLTINENHLFCNDTVLLLHSYIWGIMLLILFFLYSEKRKIAQTATYILVKDFLLNYVSFPIYKFMVSCFAYSSIENMEAICFSKTLAEFRRTTRRYIPADRTLYSCN